MPIARFPDPESAGPEGLLALGGDLHPASLLLAYRSGIFPWPIEGYPLAWFCPPRRGILELSRLHVPKRLERLRRQAPFRFTINQAFDPVIHHCASVPRPGMEDRPGPHTWITPEMTIAYCRLHALGHAHSIEAWRGEKLVGGLYGVEVDGVFAGESMFHLEDNASKLALLHLLGLLAEKNVEWVDIQMVTPHMKALGARAIPRNLFLARLARAQARRLDLSSIFSKPERGRTQK